MIDPDEIARLQAALRAEIEQLCAELAPTQQELTEQKLLLESVRRAVDEDVEYLQKILPDEAAGVKATGNTAPRVLNLRGRKGVVPEGAVYIGRACNHGPWRLQRSKWFNPYTVGRDGTREEVLARYERHLYDSGLINDIHELRGRDLACWCAPKPCHGGVLLRLANG